MRGEQERKDEAAVRPCRRGSWGRGAEGVLRRVSLPGGPPVHAAPRLHGLSLTLRGVLPATPSPRRRTRTHAGRLRA